MSDEPVEQAERDGYSIKIYQDEDAESPREWDNLGTMLCVHRRYDLGDKHAMSPSEIQALVERPDVIALPLYLYDHSGLAMSTRSFIGRAQHAEWDSGQVGFIYVTLAKVREEYSVKKVSKKCRELVIRYLENEVKTYNQYLQGDVYGFTVEKDGDVVDSCWGFYGMDEALANALQSAGVQNGDL